MRLRTYMVGVSLALAVSLLWPVVTFGGEPSNGIPADDEPSGVRTPTQELVWLAKQRVYEWYGGSESITIETPSLPLDALGPYEPSTGGDVQIVTPCTGCPRYVVEDILDRTIVVEPGCTDPEGCQPPHTRLLDVGSVQQINSYYCGPASAELVIDFSWGENRSSQEQLARYMGTTTGGTGGDAMAAALNEFANLPDNFAYFYTETGGISGWDAKIRTTVGHYGMPVVAGVAPHQPGERTWLSSWPNAVDARHYITITGYQGRYDGTARPLVYYSDSSEGYWGGTGRFSDPSLYVFRTNHLNTEDLIW